MNKTLKKDWRTILLVVCLSLTIGIVSSAVAADDSGTEKMQGGIRADTSGISQGLTTYLYNANINGGYVASGVGMRNRGWGTILMKDIPIGSTIERAYLFWSVLGPNGTNIPPVYYSKGKINGVAITGTNIGSPSFGTCWKNVGKVFGYRANVTSLVTGNKLYQLQDFASGYIWGDVEPGVQDSTNDNKYPMLEGATLVIVYKNAKYPLTRIQIREGTEYIQGTSTTTFGRWVAPTKPVAKTTYIVADGETWGESVKFNGIEMPTYFLDGKDRQNGNDWLWTSGSLFFKFKGNLQDTNTAFVKVNPGSGSVSATIGSASDCLAWIAQVFSMYEGNADTDGDALKDYWEVYGHDQNNDGIIDVNLPAMGADPFHKDIFIEVDWMKNSATETKSHIPDPSVITRTVDTFAKAPYANNPDGISGINMHIELSNEVPHDQDLNPVNAEFAAIKNANFPSVRQDTHHYALFGHGYGGGTSSGLSFGIPASDYIVTLGTWGSADTPDAETGTFIHELGHNLGLGHGGFDGENYKPNYLSIMSYAFQISGVYRSGKYGNYDYQRLIPYSLNENALNESNGIANAVGYGTKWYCPNGAFVSTTNYKPIDWNCNGATNPGTVAVDINNANGRTTLNSWLDWQHIVYNGNTIGGIGKGPRIQIKSEDMSPELTYEEQQKISKAK